MPEWAVGAPADGPLRTLITDGVQVRYATGVHALGADGAGRERDVEARIVFTDGAMRRAAVGAYEILDLDRMAPFVPRFSPR